MNWPQTYKWMVNRLYFFASLSIIIIIVADCTITHIITIKRAAETIVIVGFGWQGFLF